MGIPLYGQNKDGGQLERKVGSVIKCTGNAAVSLSASDSGSIVHISGGAAGAAACSLPHIKGQDGLEFTFLLAAANGSSDFDIDARDGVDFFIGSIVSVEGTNDVGIDFNGSSHDQLTLSSSAGAAGDKIHIVSCEGKWWIDGVTNDQNGWAVGTASANT
tara:strand:+ start:74 stop:553 length:480 start_codon:yes stop_codon:yes gene_type:complete